MVRRRRRALSPLPPPGGSPNPYLDVLCRALEELGYAVTAQDRLTVRWLWGARRDVGTLHFHWRPDRYYARSSAVTGARRRGGDLMWWPGVVVFAARLSAARLLRYRIVWTIHEVYPPAPIDARGLPGRRVHRAGGRLLARASRLLLAHDLATAQRARRHLGRAARGVEVVSHPSYVGVYPPGRDRATVRRELDIPADAFVFLCFGQLRADKRVDVLLEAFRALPAPGPILLVAGAVADGPSARRVSAAAAADARIRPILDEVPAERVTELYAAADAAVLARDETWTSGSLVLALSLGVPVVAARLEVYEDLLDRGRAGWLFEPGDAASLRRALAAACADPAAARMKAVAARRRADRLPGFGEVAERMRRGLEQTHR